MSSILSLIAGVVATTGLSLFVGWRQRAPMLRLGLRGLAVAAATAAALWAGTSPLRVDSPAAVLVLADVSASVTDSELGRMSSWIDDLAAANRSAEVVVLPFAARRLSERPLALSSWRRWLPGRQRTTGDYLGTDLSAAVTAAGEYAAGRSGVSVVMITDGHQNPAAAATGAPALQGKPFYLHPLAGRPERPGITDFITGYRARPETDLVLSARIHGGITGVAGRVRFSSASQRLDCQDWPAGAIAVNVPAGSVQAVVCKVAAAQTRGWDTGLYQLNARLLTAGGEAVAHAESFLLFEASDAPLLLDVPEKDREFWSAVLADFAPPRWRSTADLADAAPAGRTPVIIVDGAHARFDGPGGTAAARLISRNLQAGDWLIAVQGDDVHGTERLMDSAIAGLLPLIPLSEEAAGRQALAAFAIDASKSMGWRCADMVSCSQVVSLVGEAEPEFDGSSSLCLDSTPIGKPGASGYASSFALASDLVARTVAHLQPSDRLLMYLFSTRAVPLLPVGPDGSTEILDPQAESQRLRDTLKQAEQRLEPATDLCEALHQMACSMRGFFAAGAGNAGAQVRGSLFIVTDAYGDRCAERWVKKDRSRSVAGQSPLDCTPQAPTPSLGSAVEHLEAMGITPQLIIVDPCGSARVSEASRCTGQLHGEGVKNLCYLASANQLQYTELLRVYAWWKPDAENHLWDFVHKATGPLALPMSPAGTRTAAYQPVPFSPRCAPELKVCRDGRNQGYLVPHPPARACRLLSSNDRPLLFEELDQGASRRPVAAARQVTRGSGLAIQVATDPGTSYAQASPAGRQALVDFWRAILREKGAARLGKDLFLRLLPIRGGYRLEAGLWDGNGGSGTSQLRAHLRSDKGVLLADLALERQSALWTGQLTANTLRDCAPCRLRLVPMDQTAISSAPSADWPLINIYAASQPPEPLVRETAVAGRDEVALADWERRLGGHRLDRPIALAVAPAAALLVDAATRRSSWALLVIAIAALLLDIALKRLGGWRRGAGQAGRR